MRTFVGLGISLKSTAMCAVGPTGTILFPVSADEKDASHVINTVALPKEPS